MLNCIFICICHHLVIAFNVIYHFIVYTLPESEIGNWILSFAIFIAFTDVVATFHYYCMEKSKRKRKTYHSFSHVSSTTLILIFNIPLHCLRTAASVKLLWVSRFIQPNEKNKCCKIKRVRKSIHKFRKKIKYNFTEKENSKMKHVRPETEYYATVVNENT